MIIRNIHTIASERHNLNNPIQAKRSVGSEIPTNKASRRDATLQKSRNYFIYNYL